MARHSTRRLLDRSFTGLGFVSIGLMALSLIALLAPIALRGATAFVFCATVEHRKVQWDLFECGDRARLDTEIAAAAGARQPLYDMLARFEQEMASFDAADKLKYASALKELKAAMADLLGPDPGEPRRILPRDRYGEPRWERAQVKLDRVLYREEYDYSDPSRPGSRKLVPRAEVFEGTSLAPLFAVLPAHLEEMVRPRWTFYGRFLTQSAHDAHFFGGIWPEVLGTLYLTLGAMLFATPMGVIAAIYLVEYARDSWVVRLLRSCVSTLAGVPSIVFGLFGLAFFINTMRVSHSKSVLGGSLTLALLILPTIIRASEEALRAVPRTYKEAALSLGASTWRSVTTVILPAALPGILTGIVISMGRAAGETAPIIFTAAVSMGKPLTLLQTFHQPTPALPWNIYNLCTEHQAVDEVRHVQYGMVFTLVMLVLLLNLSAIVLRARLSKRLRA